MKRKILKTHFTRKNLITIGLIFFYLVCCLISAAATQVDGIMKEGNPIAAIGATFGFPLSYVVGYQAWVLEILVLFYILFFASAFMYEVRLAIYYDNKVWTKKWSLIYVGTFILSLALCFGIALVAQYPYDAELIGNSFLFMVESLVVGLVIFLLIGSIITAILTLYINFKNIDKPFRFFSSKAEEVMQEVRDLEDEERDAEQANLASSFGDTNYNAQQNAAGVGPAMGGGIAAPSEDKKEELSDKEKVFPGLCTIDYLMDNRKPDEFNDSDVNLKDLCDNFREYLAKEEGLFFDIETIRSFVAGLSASRLIILEGLSGTGKSSLARYFSEYISEKSFFEPVQATWRDRTSILGYFNDFSKTYNETEFLKRLYEASFESNHVNIMVLDELNISRIEYYFADFLSILEYPVDEWKLRIMQLPYDFEAPMHLENGILEISSTTWFIGTANKDDSTYTITDKVYDRAITISFDDRNEPFEVDHNVSKITLSYNKLMSLFEDAQNDKDCKMKREDFEKFKVLTDFTYNTFDLTFGNRIMHQIELLVPVYIKCGGKKEEALDFMFARKVVAKLEGRFEDYIKQGILDLQKLIHQTYGTNSFKLTEHVISRLLRKL